MRFCNINGDDVYIYPGFVMMQNKGADFGLIEMKDFSMKLEACRFVEEEVVPNDSDNVGTTWKKTNKDGTPDRRFSDNYQIPIVRYGQLWLSSSTGLREAYMFSNFSKAEAFAYAFTEYGKRLAEYSRRSPADLTSNADESPEIAGEGPDAAPASTAAAQRAPYLILDWLALIAIFAAIPGAILGFGLLQKINIGTSLMAPASLPQVRAVPATPQTSISQLPPAKAADATVRREAFVPRTAAPTVREFVYV